MCAAKPNPTSDDVDIQFMKVYEDMVQRSKHNRSTKRSKITKAHVAKHEELQNRIKSLKRHIPVDQHGRDGPGEQSGLGALRNLLDRKADIELRIATCMQSLETALNTTSREIQLTLRKRVEAAGDTRVSNL